MSQPRDVLIVDDEPLISRMLGRLLRPRHSVRFAETPAAALALIDERTPDVLLCDFQLAEGTASAFLREVRARWPALRVVLHSASRMELWAELLKDRIVDHVLVKPASVREILASLHAG
jgi:DNA-binding NtrC family response regulator